MKKINLYATLVVVLFLVGCSKNEDTPLNIPTVSTNVITAITSISAASGGTITSDGGTAITAKGVCWSTNTNPTIALSTKTIDGSGKESFSSNLLGLTPNTTYHVRSYATNSVGTAYGSDIVFTTDVTDVDGNSYSKVVIGNQTWMQKNLNVSKYRNGDPIPQVTDPTAWIGLTTGAWCYYNNDPANGSTYGKLYNWYAVNDYRGLAPSGYHVPSNDEWTTLTTFLGGDQVAGGAMKATTLWHSTNVAATNSSGFTGIPGGYRKENGTFFVIGYGTYWWSSSEYNLPFASYLTLNYTSGGSFSSNGYEYLGLSVRCVRD